jgi:hypothetical protein
MRAMDSAARRGRVDAAYLSSDSSERAGGLLPTSKVRPAQPQCHQLLAARGRDHR